MTRLLDIKPDSITITASIAACIGCWRVATVPTERLPSSRSIPFPTIHAATRGQHDKAPDVSAARQCLRPYVEPVEEVVRGSAWPPTYYELPGRAWAAFLTAG